MKRILWLALIALVFSCSDSSSDDTSSSTDSITGLSSPSVVFAADGGSTTITFTTSGNWTATATESWCTVSPASGSAGANTLTLAATSNSGTDERNASVTIKCGTATSKVTVSQKQPSSLSITSSKIEVDADGGTATITATYTDELTYTIASTAQSWITYSTTRATTTSTLVFDVAENTSQNSRQGEIVVSNGTQTETVTIYQAGLTPELVLSSNNYTVASAGETIAVELKSNVEFTVVMPDVSWITANTTRASSTYTLYYDIAENTTYEQRSATITYVNTANSLTESVTITQVQNDAIIVAAESYALDCTAQALDFEVNANVDFTTTVSVDWITQVTSRGLISKALCFDVAANSTTAIRKGVITFTAGNVSQTVTVTQNVDESNETVKLLATEREALIALYEATNGDKWTTNTNWCTDADVSTWYDIVCDSEGFVTQIKLYNNNLTGSLPEELDLPNKFTKLTRCYLYNNYITGTIPAWWADLMDKGRIYIDLSANCFSGELPTQITSHDNWANHWISCLYQRSGYTITLPAGATIPGPTFSVTTVNNQTITSDVYAENLYTIIDLTNPSGTISQTVHSYINEFYDAYHPKGVEVITYTRSSSYSATTLASYMEGNNYNWPAFYWSYSSNYIPALYCMYMTYVPVLFSVDNTGYVNWYTFGNYNDYTNISTYVLQWVNSVGELYESTDYSADGEVVQLQAATVGNGYNLVFLGEGFVDYDHVAPEDGSDDTYVAWMKEGMEEIFRLEPMKSLRDRFNIYTVRAVSKNNNFYNSSAEFAIGQDDAVATAYGSKAPFDSTGAAHVIVLWNTDVVLDRGHTNWWSSTRFNAYCQKPIGTLISHEGVGHGIANLYDEYINDGYTTAAITDEKVTYLANVWNNYAWGANVDTTTDTSSIKWAYWLTDSRYYGVEDLGIYEGGYAYYGSGVYRPSKDSMMNTNSEFWNAPSRERIYKAVMQVSEGNSWSYDRDTFIEFDAPYREYAASASSATRSMNATSWGNEELPGQGYIDDVQPIKKIPLQ